jgi:hypothetical protein
MAFYIKKYHLIKSEKTPINNKQLKARLNEKTAKNQNFYA